MSSGFLTTVSDHDGWSLDVTKIQTTKLSILLRFYFHGVLEQLKTNFQTNLRFKKVLLVSVRHVAAHPDELQHGVSLQSSINLGKTFPRISRIRIIPSTQILARVFVYLPPFISQILDFICRMVLIFFLSILNGVTLKTGNKAKVVVVYKRVSKTVFD